MPRGFNDDALISGYDATIDALRAARTTKQPARMYGDMLTHLYETIELSENCDEAFWKESDRAPKWTAFSEAKDQLFASLDQPDSISAAGRPSVLGSLFDHQVRIVHFAFKENPASWFDISDRHTVAVRFEDAFRAMTEKSQAPDWNHEQLGGLIDTFTSLVKYTVDGLDVMTQSPDEFSITDERLNSQLSSFEAEPYNVEKLEALRLSRHALWPA